MLLNFNSISKEVGYTRNGPSLLSVILSYFYLVDAFCSNLIH